MELNIPTITRFPKTVLVTIVNATTLKIPILSSDNWKIFHDLDLNLYEAI